MRFRTEFPKPKCPVYATYATISRTLDLEYNTVQHLCRYAFKFFKNRKKIDPSRKLDQVHIDFLTSPETLKIWAGFPLKERSKLFHRKFPNKRIAVTSLRRLYSTHRIKRKVVR